MNAALQPYNTPGDEPGRNTQRGEPLLRDVNSPTTPAFGHPSLKKGGDKRVSILNSIFINNGFQKAIRKLNLRLEIN